MNVNFPENLDISPSTHPEEKLYSITKPNAVFGTLAQRQAIEKYGIAGRIWEAAYFLSKYVCPPQNVKYDPPFVVMNSPRRPLAVLELGSGTGMTSSRIADILKDEDILIATDLPEVCPLLESNIQRSTTSTSFVHVRPLAWGNKIHATDIAYELLRRPEGPLPLTHVVCSDLIYFPELLAPLLRTLIHVTSPPFSPPMEADGINIVISYKLRSLSKESPFWSAFGLWFRFEPVLVTDTSSESIVWQRLGASLDDPVFIFVGFRRPESFSWTIPESDSDLLAGRGAMGNDTVKSDDAFETLLFMTMDDINEE